jgi:hypothetical protein
MKDSNLLIIKNKKTRNIRKNAIKTIILNWKYKEERHKNNYFFINPEEFNGKPRI